MTCSIVAAMIGGTVAFIACFTEEGARLYPIAALLALLGVAVSVTP